MRVRPLVVGLTVSAVSFAMFWELAGEYAASPVVETFDSTVSAAIQSLRTPPLTAIMMGITLLGSTFAVAAATVVVVLLLWRRRRRSEAVYAAALVAGGGMMIALFKNVFDRPRPAAQTALVSLPASFSFPSGHTMGSLCLAWALGWLVVRSEANSRVRAALLALCVAYPVLVGTSRVYLGVHWPSDVLASWLLAASWIALATGVRLAITGRAPMF